MVKKPIDYSKIEREDSHQQTYEHHFKIDLVENIARKQWIASNKGKSMDSCPAPDAGISLAEGVLGTAMPIPFFLGFQFLAILAQNPFIQKACGMFANSTTSKWGRVETTEEGNSNWKDQIDELDKKFKIKSVAYRHMFNAYLFGGSLALYVCKNEDGTPFDYSKPFNLDLITKGTFKGVKAIDPVWVRPIPDSNLTPADLDHYEPEYYQIGGDPRNFHKSWFSKIVPYEVSDILKPTYYFFGISLAQYILPYVENTERCIREAPELLLTKRLLAVKADMGLLVENPQAMRARIKTLVDDRDNSGVLFLNAGDPLESSTEDLLQVDTALSDVTAVIEQQISILSMITGTPFTKFSGSSPQGMNATGEFESQTFYDSTAEKQETSLRDFIDKYYRIAIKSELELIEGFSFVFNPLEEQSDKERAEILNMKSDMYIKYINSGVVFPEEVRNELIQDKMSGFNGLEELSQEELPDMTAGLGGGYDFEEESTENSIQPTSDGAIQEEDKESSEGIPKRTTK